VWPTSEGVRLNRLQQFGALAAWTAVVILATASWRSTRDDGRVFHDPVPAPTPIALSVGGWAALGRDPWMLTEERFFGPAEIHVRREELASGIMRTTIDNADGFSSHVVTIDLHTEADGKSHAEAAVTWTADIGPPFSGSMTNVTGDVSFSAIDWSGKQPVAVSFELHGSIEGRSRCVHGQVILIR
jgi:hypothetical protein